MKFSRGLAALILIVSFQSSLLAEYLYKDEVIFNQSFSAEIEKVGLELHEKTGIALRLVMLRELSHGQSIVEYEKELMKNFTEPTILLTFSELDTQVDILANSPSLYEYFDKRQVLSPVASHVQAFIMAVFYSDSIDSFKEIITSSGGSILPLLAQKAKDNEQLGKYSGSMFNGYIDIAEQIAASKNIVLDSAVGDSNKYSILLVKTLFYGILFYGIFMYIKRKLYIRRQKIEQK